MGLEFCDRFQLYPTKQGTLYCINNIKTFYSEVNVCKNEHIQIYVSYEFDVGKN